MSLIAKRRALGRGLGALIPSGQHAEAPAQPTEISVASIHPNPMQPRQVFSETGIEELAASIREKGILQPLVVRRSGDGFELIAGERRFRAALRVGLERVPIIVREASDGEMLEIALIENIQRENLNPLEEARAYRRMIDELQLTQEQIAVRVGKDRSTIANALRLLQLPEEVQLEIERGALSAGHARALAGAAHDAAKVDLARRVIAQRLTVRQTERLAKHSSRPLADADQKAAEEQLTRSLGTRVRLVNRRNGAGKIEIEYYSLDELNGLMVRLCALEGDMKF